MQTVLTLNGGSSSIRFAFYEVGAERRKLMEGKVERIGLPDTRLSTRDSLRPESGPHSLRVPGNDSQSATTFLLDWLESQSVFGSLTAVGHRIVHGMQRADPAKVTDDLIAELKRLTAYDPEHLPREIDLMARIGRRFSHLQQVACFDTAFHRTMPRVATVLPLPRRYQAMGLQRYGFHGLSYTFLLAELVRLGDGAATRGRVLLAHLGNGASLAAVRDGKCIDTSMAFTPAAGLVMSTRTGDLDPGIMSFLASEEKMSPAAFQRMVNHESGLLGISEISSDIRDLLEREPADERAADAVAIFCYQAKKWLGAFAAALGGIDTLVFSGGIGENAARVRERICEGLNFLGIELDETRNARSEAVISTGSARVTVRVIRTDEEAVIADSTIQLLGLH